MNKRSIIFASLGVILALAVLGVFLEPTRTVLGFLRGDKFFESRSTSYWRGVLAGDDYAALQSPEAVPVLTQILGDRNFALRTRAAILLGKIGPDASAAVPDLLKSITDKDGKIDHITVKYLQVVAEYEKQNVDEINVKFETEEDEAHFHAANAIKKIDPAAAKQAGLP